ncbi:MAG: AsmA family protein [Kiloniellaceae bacterium]
MKLKRVLTVTAAVTAAVLVAGYAMIASLDVQKVADFAREEVKAATGRDLVIAGPVGLQVSLTPSIDLEDVRFANAPWGSRPEMVTLRRLEIEVALLPLLTGDVVVRRLVAVEPDILLETDAGGRGNWEFDSAAEAAPPAAGAGSGPVSLPDVQDFRIEGGRLRLVEADGDGLDLEVTEAVGALPAGGGARSLRLVAAYNGNPFTVEGSYSGLPALLSGPAGPVDLVLEAGGARLTAKGTAGDLTGGMTVDLAVTAAGDSLAGLSPWLGAELPALGPYSLSTNLKSVRQAIELAGIVVNLGGSDLTGNATFSPAGARPAVTATLLSRRLDLADFAAESESGGGSAGRSDRVFPDTPLPLEALRAVDAEVKLDAEHLIFGGMSLEAVRTTLALKGGDLAVAPFAARLADGSLAGRLDLKASRAEPELALKLDGQDIDFGELLRQAAVTEDIGGPLELAVDFKGRGASPHAIAASLDGHLQAVSLDGTVDNRLLRVLSVGLGDVLGPLFGGSQSTRLECFVARFDFAGGQGRSRALVLDTGAFALAGRGGLDLDAERVNLAFDTRTPQPSLASLAVPFKVTGPLSDPSVTPDPIGAAVGAVGTVGDVARTGGNIVGGAVDSVGGLIGTGPIIGEIGGSRSLCGEALAAIGHGGSAGETPSGGAPASSGSVLDDVGGALKDAGDGIQRGLRSLFGD